MKAAMWYGVKDVRVVEVPEQVTEAGTVKIQVEWCGICGSDLHEYAAGPMTIPVETPHPLTGQVAPVILGHEFAGKVVEIGSGVTHVRVGDRVAVEPLLSCGQCRPCQSGRYNLCVKRGFHGLTSNGGGFSERTVVPVHLVHKLPDNLSFEEGAIVEPAAVAVQAVYSSGIKLGDTCAVLGAGPIGLLLTQAVKAAGASTVIVVEVSEERLAKAEELGATHLINPRRQGVLDTILALTDGQGVDVSFEAAGVEAALSQALKCLKMNGELVIVSLWERPVSINPNLLVLHERKITSSAAYCRMYPRVLSLIANGQINAMGLISKKIKLADIVSEGFEALLMDKSQSKILVTPN
ncbi:2,3-butanediol dehydrogenase [Alicyclobacillus dauci]|uniref:2,3-butanediol dehydrogenase n=1 Tax=Alicyclobacillus dauci TaxID=1475485 RepID=A0ABY6YYK4_9BACL|nr:2,3-butanediol dehydrogenase [Alicyclobacillus dauci]WAH35708.1 2,3-butanediol dehydrogenase [Alicyclobacillus dauci]